jgi:hypothetical protein
MFGVLDNLATQSGNGGLEMIIGKEKVVFPTTTERDKAIFTFLNDANNAIISEDDSY